MRSMCSRIDQASTTKYDAGKILARPSADMTRLEGVTALAVFLAVTFTTFTAAQVVKQAVVQPANQVDPSRTSITQYKVDGWQTEQGLPLNTVQTVYQSRASYLWVGTAAGLARFDGLRFATFESSPVPELVSRPIFGFMEDVDGTLWIGHGPGAALYRNGRFERAFDNALMDGRRV